MSEDYNWTIYDKIKVILSDIAVNGYWTSEQIIQLEKLFEEQLRNDKNGNV